MYSMHKPAPNWLIRLVEKLPHHKTTPQALALRYGFALATVALAYLGREFVGPSSVGLPLLTFFSAAALTLILTGIGPGLLAAAIGMSIGTCFYMPPYGVFTFEFASGNVLSNLVFAFNIVLLSLVVKALQIYFDRYLANRRLLSAIVEGSKDAIYVKDLQGRYRFMNAAGKRYLGQAADATLEQSDGVMFSAETRAQLAAQDQQVLAQGKVIDFETAIDTPGGRRIFHSTKGPLQDEQDRMIGIFGLEHDITRSKQIEEALQEKLAIQEQFVNLAALVPGTICTYRRNASGLPCFPYASASLGEIFGLSPEEVREDASAAFARIHADDMPHVLDTTQQAMNYGSIWNTGFRVNHPQKGEIWVEGFLRPVQQADGTTLWHGYLQDITTKRHAEEQMHLAAGVFDTITEGIVVTSPQNRILAVNEAFIAMTGYTREELLNQTPRLMHAERHDAAFFEAMQRKLLEHGRWEGEVWNRRKNGELYLKWLSVRVIRDGAGNLASYISVFRDISLVKNSEERVEFLGTHDDLTHLPNRTLLNDRLRQAVNRAERSGHRLALMFVDIDNFKLVNETFGHTLGDNLLLQTAERLKDCVRCEDTVARMGGDEFVMILEDCERDAVIHTAERILARLSEIYRVGGQECFTAASIGISFYPDDATEPSDLLRYADNAMYRAKEKGKNNIQLFSEDMAERSRKRLEIERSLRHAIERNEFFLEYQPQIDLGSHTLIGVEALIRWRHGGKTIPPLDFIPIAEETRLIITIGEWVVKEACRQIKVWDRNGLSPFTVSVNISARHFLDPNMVIRLHSIIQDAEVDPRRLCLEITEGAMEDIDNTMTMLQELEELGFRTSIDDFGTGFSSLSHLKRFPLHELKIDRSFVDGIIDDQDDRAITSTIISMAGNLELSVVAEGIETTEQLQELHGMGCQIGQGYYFSKPLTADRFNEWLSNRKSQT
ncbi:putative Diguanylate cyclase [Sterolibacterium denitrificans]|uniref:Diguanylate cyclase n=1 Tax=Sterolibacterium denitrificans TaxID=157592 RepID=A0A7Z7HUA0_9PROT|nr:EAL domain-containing protein [Sterolibacterium denitrificans]SMB29384.1 putative Diguanylate cyclase [Sterolibacterium denitrificans]